MSAYITAHLSGFWIALGFVLLIVDMLFFGFTTLVLLFTGVAAILTGIAIKGGLLPGTWEASIACFGIVTGVIGATLWKPLRKMQGSSAMPQQQSSDLIGYEFVLQQDVTALNPGSHRYSGVAWRIELDKQAGEILKAGERVAVTSLDAGVFRVNVSSPYKE